MGRRAGFDGYSARWLVSEDETFNLIVMMRNGGQAVKSKGSENRF